MTDESNADTAQKWRRRERALTGGLVLWALGVSALATIRPEQLAELITTTSGPVLAGAILISAGLFGGFVDTLLLAASRWAEPSDPEGLTEVPWDE